MSSYRRFPWLFILPSLVGFLAFNAGPILISLILSFTKWDVFNPLSLQAIKDSWIGFGNYVRMWQDPTLHKAFWNTLYYVAVAVPLEIFISLMVALGLNRDFPGVKLVRTLYLLPTVTSIVAVGLLWRWVLNPYVGPVNVFLRWLGSRMESVFTFLHLKVPATVHWLATQGPGWLSDEHWAMPGIILAAVWAGIGFRMLIFLAGLQNIDKTYYEAAALDGAGPVQQFWHVTMPLLSPTIFLNTLLALIGGFQVFGLVYVMTGGGPLDATNVLLFYLYQKAFGIFPPDMGYASAIAWLLFILLFGLTVIQWQLRKRWVWEEA
ncbi:carbohydrate ABC transporter permease [Oceanithermus sp.]